MKASGKFVLRISPLLHSRLRRDARSANLSLNELILQRIESPFVSLPLKNAINAVFGDDLLGVILFGSVARGESRKDSDVDLLIVLDSSRPVSRSLYTLWDKEVAREVESIYSPQFVHPPGAAYSSLWLEVATEGEILYEQQGALKNILRRIREEIAQGCYTRKMIHGHPYWIRKGTNE